MPTIPNIKDSTRPITNHSISTLIETIQCLQQDLMQSKAERSQLSNQLSCLISLVKRSWTGDKVASYHVANIIGIPVPKDVEQMTNSFLDIKTRAIMNWEKLSLCVLDKQYETMQEEIKESQQHYINCREMYMDEILNSHQEQMSQLSLHKNSISSIQDVDQSFMKSYKPNSRPPSSKTKKKSSSAKRRPGKIAEEMVDIVDIGVHNLLFNTDNDKTVNTKAFCNHRNGSENDSRVNGNYDDSNRYTMSNLFNTEDALGKDAFQRKKRPVSATELREKDQLRSRPKSATTGFLPHKTDRPLKYETTRPVSGKNRLKSHGDRRGSLEYRDGGNCAEDDRETVLTEQSKAKAELKSRIKLATQRHKGIDTFDDEMKAMTNMEAKFKQTAVNLQRKLGINKGLI